MKRKRLSPQQMADVLRNRRQANKLFEEIFSQEPLSEKEMSLMHEVCTNTLADVDCKTAIRVEVYILLHICQPEQLFYKRKYITTVEVYVKNKLNITISAFSYYKKDLVFLYTHDKRFRGLANMVEQEVQERLSSENE